MSAKCNKAESQRIREPLELLSGSHSSTVILLFGTSKVSIYLRVLFSCQFFCGDAWCDAAPFWTSSSSGNPLSRTYRQRVLGSRIWNQDTLPKR